MKWKNDALQSLNQISDISKNYTDIIYALNHCSTLAMHEEKKTCKTIIDWINKNIIEIRKNQFLLLLSPKLIRLIHEEQSRLAHFPSIRIPILVSTRPDALWVVPNNWASSTIYALVRLWRWCSYACDSSMGSKILPLKSPFHKFRILEIAKKFTQCYNGQTNPDSVIYLLHLGRTLMNIFKMPAHLQYSKQRHKNSKIVPYELMSRYNNQPTLFSAKGSSFVKNSQFHLIHNEDPAALNVCQKFYAYVVHQDIKVYKRIMEHPKNNAKIKVSEDQKKFWYGPKPHVTEKIMVLLKRHFEDQEYIIKQTGQLAVNIATANMQDTYDEDKQEWDKQEGDKQEGDKQEGDKQADEEDDGYRTPNDLPEELGTDTPNPQEGTILIPRRDAQPNENLGASQLLAVHRALEFLDRHHMSQTTPERETLCFKSRPSAQEKLLHFFRSKPE